jgi:hypothetical protein
MNDLDLSFDASEVLAHSRVDDALDQALRACSCRTISAVGAVFRALRDRDLAGLRLRRDGRLWRLERTCRGVVG